MKKTLYTVVISISILTGCAGTQTHWSEHVTDLQPPAEWQTSIDNSLEIQQSTHSVLSLLDLVAMPELEKLVQKSLKGNPNLQQILLILKSAGLSLERTEGDQLPTVSAELGRGRNELNSGGHIDNYSSGIIVGWELDLWQKLSDQSKAAELDKTAAAEDYRYARASLVANVIKSYLNLIATQNRVNLERKRVQILNNNQKIIIDRYRTGNSSLDDLESARTSYANAMANLIQLEETLVQDKRSLSVLIGENHKTDDAFFKDITRLSQLPNVVSPLVEIPLETISKRPDIKAALIRIEAEDARTRASYKALLPRFSLSAGLNFSSASSASAMLFKDPVWSLLGNITAPLFNGGQLKADAKIQELSAEKAYWSYRETLLSAVQEIENALGNEKSLQHQQGYLVQALQSAKNSEKNYQQRYRQGLVDILDLLIAQQSRFNTEDNLIQTQVNLLTNRIDLALSLGLGV